MKEFDKVFIISKKTAFTLSEFLITLVIVGVVAVLTIPALINKINDKQYARARERVLLSVGEAGKILAVQGEINSANDAEDFVKNYLAKYLKIIQYCGSTAQDITKCGFPAQITKMGGSGTIAMPNTIGGAIHSLPLTDKTTVTARKSYAILMANGYSANVYYNPKCITKNLTEGSIADSICVNVVYDMNGKSGPNKVGKDIGWVTVIGNDDSVVAVAPAFEQADATENYIGNNATQAKSLCSDKNKRVPNMYELLSVAYNYKLVNFKGYRYWTSNTTFSPASGTIGGCDYGYMCYVRCVTNP